MKSIKNISVTVTYKVGLHNFNIPENVYDEIISATDNGDIIYGGDLAYPNASEWFSENIKESDCFEWQFEIDDISFNKEILRRPEKPLTSRYKLLQDYPGNTHLIGYVFDHNLTMDFDKYPNIFKPLGWHKERKAEDMPDYVKDSSGCVKKVYKHFTYILLEGSMKGEHEVESVCSFDEINGYEKLFWRYDSCTPATEKEFKEYEVLRNKTR